MVQILTLLVLVAWTGFLVKIQKEYKKLEKERYEHAKSIGMSRWL